jgi:hypothetical protein
VIVVNLDHVTFPPARHFNIENGPVGSCESFDLVFGDDIAVQVVRNVRISIARR